MKSIETGSIVTGAAAKIKKGTFKHLQDAYQEAIAAAIINAIGAGYDASKYYILYGCENTGTGLNYIISAGAVLVSGIVYITPAKTFTATAGQVAAFQTVDAYVSGTEYDPVSFTDGSTHNIHRDRTGDWYSVASTSAANEYAFMPRIANSESLTLTANYSAGLGTTPKVYREGNKGSFSGAILCGASAATGQTITTLSSNYRPSVNRAIPLLLNDNGGNFRMASISILTTGVVQLTFCNSAATTAASPATYYIYLDGVTFRI